MGKFIKSFWIISLCEKIIFVFHPDCGFSRKAFLDFHPPVLEKLKATSLFVVPTGQNPFSDFQKIKKWTLEHPDIGVFLVPGAEPLKEISTSSVPAFYIINRGKLEKTIEGWPKDGSQAPALEEALRSL